MLTTELFIKSLMVILPITGTMPSFSLLFSRRTIPKKSSTHLLIPFNNSGSKSNTFIGINCYANRGRFRKDKRETLKRFELPRNASICLVVPCEFSTFCIQIPLFFWRTALIIQKYFVTSALFCIFAPRKRCPDS